MQERCQKVRVMDFHWQINQDILVPQVGLLDTEHEHQHTFLPKQGGHKRPALPLCGELALLVGGHEAGRQAVSFQAQATLAAPRHIEDEGHSALVLRALVEVLVLDEVRIDEATHVAADVPAHVLRVGIDLAQELDHLILVRNIALGARGSGGQRGSVLLVIGVAVD